MILKHICKNSQKPQISHRSVPMNCRYQFKQVKSSLVCHCWCKPKTLSLPDSDNSEFGKPAFRFKLQILRTCFLKLAPGHFGHQVSHRNLNGTLYFLQHTKADRQVYVCYTESNFYCCFVTSTAT